jgi:RHS repeat-associated protein
VTETFTYDALNRLDASQRNGVTHLDVTLDAIGNITWKQGVGNYTYHATRKRAVIAAGSNSYAYDANGNMTGRNGSTIGYTSYNLPNVIMAGSNSSTLSYGAFRNRYKQVSLNAGTYETTIYVGGMLEKVSRSAAIEYRHRILGGKGVAAIYTRRTAGSPLNDTYYVHADHLGSPELITDSAGAQGVKLSFGAYGERRGSNWSGAPSSSDWTAIGNTTRDGFTGHEHLDAVSLIHMNGRVYDPVIGRFLSKDPIVELGLSQSPNSYSYVWNNPLSLTDPSGWVADQPNPPAGDLTEFDEIFVIGLRPPNWMYDYFVWMLEFARGGAESGLREPRDGTRGGGSNGGTSESTENGENAAEEAREPQNQQQCIRPPDHGDFGDKAADFAVGFGDAFLIPIIVRNLAGIEGTTDYDSAAYGAGKITGLIEGLVPMALQGTAAYSAAAAARGAPSVLNANRYFRIGPGVGWGGTNVPRVSSPFLPGDGHVSLTSRLPLIPPLGALFSAGGGCSGGN